MNIKEKGQKTKKEVIHSAVKLFNMNGYNGTSVRAIAADAGVNVALISYYFGGKKGLLEYLMSSFLEGYIQHLEQAFIDTESANVTISERLLEIADQLIQYQQEAFYLARFVHREMTLDSVLIRELMSTYLMKEKYIFEKVFEAGIKTGQIKNIPIDLLVMQFRDMIIMPFLQPQYIRKVYYMQPKDDYFRRCYLTFIKHWTNQILTGQPYDHVLPYPSLKAKAT
ncbi:AcrR family transcriptional regulator [Scopulibacillus daqui]|uniref:AcrR family transcriptional regulator n=1 Tax=Scopulibacillus daqui TaxID=1469162 RepID=A0ABS2PYP3_9BACL|nr:forespore capture DNA-binding protein RefZ [Scopulibacillus daqui]MBM7644830.1 AcrR family transcriptional regulator [Scopulibacillus daqui]